MYVVREFKRANGETMKIEVAIDTDALVRDIAGRMALRGKETMRIAGGAVVARQV